MKRRGLGVPTAISTPLVRTVVLVALGSSSAVQAEEPDKRVVTISEVTIVGRIQRPIAAVDVSRIQPHLTLSELKQSFTDRIERALYRAPF